MTPDLPDLLILRHGETEWNAAGRMQGGADSPLTARGIAQAERQRELLAGVVPAEAAAFCSPAGRARATAGIALPGRRVTADPDLREIDMGAWRGRSLAEIAAAHPALFADPDRPLAFYRAIPGGETLEAVETRCRRFLARLTGPVVIVTHGVTSRVLRCAALGLPLDDFERLPGGQGVVWRISEGRQQQIG